MNLYTYPNKSKEFNDKLWDDAILVLDTSALCSLYNLSDHYRTIMINILKHFSDRLWIPYQVKFEYERNRKKAINNPICEKYKDPSFVKNTFVKDVRAQIEIWKKNTYYHPFLEQTEIDQLSKLIEQANDKIKKIKEIVTSEYNKRKSEIHQIEKDDTLEKFINTLPVGTPFSFKEIKDIAVEGFFRYQNEIPPGYMDSKTIKGEMPKTGIRKYGDLIVWKEIMSHASTINKDVILLIDDCKEDWYDKKEHKGLPRVELLTEFEEETNQKIWFYTTQQFIEELKERYHEEQQMLPLYDKLEDVTVILDRLAEEKKLDSLHCGESMTLKCEKCHKKFKVWSDSLEWDTGGTFYQGMGAEQEWFAQYNTECPFCHSEVEIDSFIFEYPEGAYNYGETDCFGAEKISEWNLNEIFNEMQNVEINDEEESCIHCGKWDILDESGLCPECKEEMNSKINSDD